MEWIDDINQTEIIISLNKDYTGNRALIWNPKINIYILKQIENEGIIVGTVSGPVNRKNTELSF